MRPVLLVPALLVLTAGCLGSPSVGPVATNETPAAEISTSSADDTITAPVPPDAPENAVAFENLTDRQQEAFLDALDGDVRFAPASPYIEGAYDQDSIGMFRIHDYVRYGGRYYRVSTESHANRYMAFTIKMERWTPGPNETVVAFEDLPPKIRDEVGKAIEKGSHRVPYGKWSGIPNEFHEFEYVRYENRTYKLTDLLWYDAPGYELTVSEYRPSPENTSTPRVDEYVPDRR